MTETKYLLILGVAEYFRLKRSDDSIALVILYYDMKLKNVNYLDNFIKKYKEGV